MSSKKTAESDRGWKRAPLFRSRRGSASALIILLLVLLIFFGVLGLVSAAADLRMAQRRAAWSQSYYAADGKGQQVIARIKKVCRQSDFLEGSAENRVALLTDELADPAVRDLSVKAEDTFIQIDARIVMQGDVEQGIDIELLVYAPLSPGQEPDIRMIRWCWWRTPFDYSQQADMSQEG
ncbi:MAG: hypothetical protein KBG64_02550 [Clostridia bacterium]|nr:hypothetical protein [Clostridia bacterium]